MKKIIITAGGTSERIDNVRKITNSSSGRLGMTIANYLLEENNDLMIYYVCSKNSLRPTDTYLVDCTRNVLDKLYRMFVGDRAREALKDDISKYGCKSFKVTILDPVSSDDTSITWLKTFESVMNNDGSNLYNKSKYDKLTNCVK